MRIARHFALATGMLLVFPPPGCARALNLSKPGHTHSVSPADRDRFLQMAESAVAKAVVLQQKQTEKDLNAAIGLFRESVRLFQAAGSDTQAAEALLQLGETYVVLSRYEKALSSFAQVLNLVPKNRELRCRALSRMSGVYADTGRHSLADEYSTKALSLSEGLSTKTQAEALDAAAEVSYRHSDAANAAELFSRAGEFFAQAGDNNGLAQTRLMLAFIRVRSDRQEAFRLVAQALQLWSTENNQRGIARVRHALGIFAAIADEFETARCNYQDALPAFQRIGDNDNEATVLNVMGYATLEMGDAQASLEYYRRAESIFARAHDLLGRVEAVKGMGRAFRSMGQYRRLLPLYQLKLHLAQQTTDRAQIASALAEIAAVYEQQHQYLKAETFYRRSLTAYDSLHLGYGVANAYMGLAHVRAGQGQDSDAISFLQQALPLKDKAGQIEDVARIYYELAFIYRRLNRLQEAREAIEKTIDIIESQRLTISKFDSRASYFASVHRYYALYIQVLMLLHRQDPQSGLMQLAFEASEKSKVRALLDLLSASNQESSCQDLLQKQLAPPQSTGLQVVEAKPNAPQPLSLQQVQAELQDDQTILLEYALGDEKSYVWIVDRKGIVAQELPPADNIRRMVDVIRVTPAVHELLPSDKTATDYRKRVHQADLAFQRSARSLSASLLGPADLNPEKRLLIVPDGLLQFLPFSALPSPEPGDKNAMLVKRHELVILPSASALATLRREGSTRAPSPSKSAIFADPVYERDDPRVSPYRSSSKKEPHPARSSKITRRRGGLQDMPRLPASGQEAQAIRKILGPENAVVVEGFEATRDYVLRSNLAQYGTLHFATHAFIDPLHPEMSGLFLSLINRRGQKEDGLLRLGDIYELKLSPGLVVLSACDSALGKDVESEGIIGLPRAFLHAGARCVVASLWKVDDEATEQFMEGFYDRIKSGDTPGSALQKAQIAMSRSNRWSNPYYWAAFVAQGDCK